MEQKPEQLYTINQVAELLSISRRTMFALLERGELDTVSISWATRIPASAIAAYQQRNRHSARRAASIACSGRGE